MSESPTDRAKKALLGHIRAIAALREARREINADIAERKKMAKDEGFEAKRIEEVVRWQEQCDKHGREAVDDVEAMFELYRNVLEGEAKPLSDQMATDRDRELLAVFAGEDQLAVSGPTKKQKAVNAALTGAQISRMNRGIK